MADCCGANASDSQQRRLLWLVLGLNAAMFVVEFTAGWLADSSGLLADSLDMLADAAVYCVSLYAVGRALQHKARAAMLNGGLQLALGILVLLDIGKRIWLGSEPQVGLMYWIASLALIVNILCFGLLFQFRAGDINLRASWICSRNDMLANVGVLVAAMVVSQVQKPWPDWLIGGLIAAIIIRSAWRIVSEARVVLAAGTGEVTACCAGAGEIAKESASP